MIKKILFFGLCLILLSSFVSAGYKTTYNAFTGKLDYVSDGNFSGEEINFGNVTVEDTVDSVNGVFDWLFLNTTSGGRLSSPANSYLRVGDVRLTDHNLNGKDDLLINGKLEVDSYVFIDGGFYPLGTTLFSASSFVQDDVVFGWGSVNDARIVWDTTQTNDAWVFGNDNYGNSMIIMPEDDIGTANYGHPHQDDTTVFIHSNNGAVNDSWMSLAMYDSPREGRVSVGSGKLRFSSVNDTVFTDDVVLEQDLSTGDLDNPELFSVVSNGTHVVLETYESLPLVVDTYTIGGTATSCYVNNTHSFVCEAR